MSDDRLIKPPFGAEEHTSLWSALDELPREEPPERLRRNFYRALERRAAGSFTGRLQAWLGISGQAGWLTAAACLLAGIAVGVLTPQRDTAGQARLSALEQNVALLNRELILDRLQDSAASNRLRGVMEASAVVAGDTEIVRALLLRATEDRVHSVRTAAIDALGPSLDHSPVGTELMRLLRKADSPLVQFALVDLVLRRGNAEQLGMLQELAAAGLLHPDLVRHVEKSLGRESA